jgi:excisionase family DNA binding protein
MAAAMNHEYAADVPREPTGRSVLVNEAAELLGVSRRTVYYRIQSGRLRTIRTRGGSSRVLLASIEALLREARGLPPLEGRAEGEGEPTRAGSDTKPLSL